MSDSRRRPLSGTAFCRSASFYVTPLFEQFDHTAKLYRFDGVQLGDFVVGKAEFLEHFIGVLADLRRRGDDLARRARQRDRLADEGLHAAVGPGGVLRNAEMLDLLVGKGLVDGIDRPA